MLVLAAALGASCTGGSFESACQTPHLEVSPDSVQPGAQLTVTWVGLISCEDAPIVSTSHSMVELDVAVWHGYPSPDSPAPLDVAVENWAQLLLTEATPSESVGLAMSTPTDGGPSVTAAIPTDLAPGQYSIVVVELPDIYSLPFTVSSG